MPGFARTVSGSNATWLAIVVALLGVEAYTVLADQTGTFRTRGRLPYEISEFAERKVVAHAFLMRGDSLHAVRVKLISSNAAAVRLQWRLFAGHPDEPADRALAFEGIASFDVRPGPQWQALDFTRHGSSNDRWFTLELQLLDAVANRRLADAPAPRVVLMATSDNPARGGVLWVDSVRQPGSLMLDANTVGRTPYRRFKLEAEPFLPAPFQSGLVQVLVVVAFHWAFLVFAWSLLSEASRRSALAVRQ